MTLKSALIFVCVVFVASALTSLLAVRVYRLSNGNRRSLMSPPKRADPQNYVLGAAERRAQLSADYDQFGAKPPPRAENGYAVVWAPELNSKGYSRAMRNCASTLRRCMRFEIVFVRHLSVELAKSARFIVVQNVGHLIGALNEGDGSLRSLGGSVGELPPLVYASFLIDRVSRWRDFEQSVRGGSVLDGQYLACETVSQVEWCKRAAREHGVGIHCILAPWGVAVDVFAPAVPPAPRRSGAPLVLFKSSRGNNGDEREYQAPHDVVMRALSANGVASVHVLQSGAGLAYAIAEFVDVARNAPWALLSLNYETLGNVIQELRALDVPLFIVCGSHVGKHRERGFFTVRSGVALYNFDSSAPQSFDLLKDRLHSFLANLERFEPRQEVMAVFSQEVCASQFASQVPFLDANDDLSNDCLLPASSAER
jgi:hypothetical protein